MRKKRMRKDEKREVTPEFVNMSKEILYPQIQGVTFSCFLVEPDLYLADLLELCVLTPRRNWDHS
jgi:hypothetical protein